MLKSTIRIPQVMLDFLLILILFLVVVGILSMDKCSKKTSIVPTKQRNKTTIIKDKDGNTRAQSKIIVEYTIDPQQQMQIEKLSKQLGIKEKQIKEMATALSEFKTTFVPTIDSSSKDSIKINYSSKWFDLSGTLKPLLFTATLRDSVTFSVIEKRKFLGLKKELYIDVSSANKEMKYYNVEAFKIKSNPKKFNIGITTGYGVQFSNRSLTHGIQSTIGLTYNIF